MFEIGFSELVLVMIIGLVVLGPERLPIAVRTVAGWIKAMRSLAATVQNELTQELKLQELQDSLKKVEQKASLQALSPELKASMDELKSAAQAIQRSYQSDLNPIQAENKADTEQVNTIGTTNTVVTDTIESTTVVEPPSESGMETKLTHSDKILIDQQHSIHSTDVINSESEPTTAHHSKTDSTR